MSSSYVPSEPSYAALLALFRSKAEHSPANEGMAALAEALESEPLAAFARCVSCRIDLPDFGRFELESESLEENGYYDDMVEEFARLEIEIEEAILIGTTGGGEEALLMLAEGDVGYRLYYFAYDGSPYENDQPVLPIGTFGDLFARLREEDDIDESIEALLNKLGR